MAHHKRRRHKTKRDGCLLCKPHKRTGGQRGAWRPSRQVTGWDMGGSRQRLEHLVARFEQAAG